MMGLWWVIITLIIRGYLLKFVVTNHKSIFQDPVVVKEDIIFYFINDDSFLDTMG